MKELSGSAGVAVAATVEECITLLTAVERYGDWHPELIRRAEVLERGRDGTPIRAAATVHVAVGPIERDFNLLLDVEVGAGRVRLVRVANDRRDGELFEVLWTVAEGHATEVSVALRAALDVPRFLPLGGVGDSVAQGFADAARRELEGSSPNASASSS